MIWVILTILLIIFSCKELSFLNDSFSFKSENKILIFLSLSSILIIFLIRFADIQKKKKLFFTGFVTLFIIVSFNFSSINLIIFFITIEITIFPIIILIIFLSKDYDKISSTTLIVLINIVGSLPFILFLPSLSTYQSKIRGSFLDIRWNNKIIIFIFFSIILASKIPILFFHLWLTKAHVRASGACSIILARIIIKIGIRGILFFFQNIQNLGLFLFNYTIRIALWCSLTITITITRFFDKKFMLASSSIIHISIMIVFLSNYFPSIVSSIIFISIGHGIASLTLFYYITVTYESHQNRSSVILKNIESVAKILQILILFWFIVNIGIPPFINFLREVLTIRILIEIRKFSIILLSLRILRVIICIITLLSRSTNGKKNLLSKNQEIIKIIKNFVVIILIIILSPLVLFTFSLKEHILVKEIECSEIIFLKRYSMTTFLALIIIFYMIANNVYTTISSRIFINPILISQINYATTINNLSTKIFIFIVFFVTSIVLLYRSLYIEHYNNKKFLILTVIFFLSILILRRSSSIIILARGWEGLGISSIFLVIFYPNKTAIFNSFLTIFFNRIGDVIIIIIIGLFILFSLQNIDFRNLNKITCILFFACGMTKRAQFPLSSWLPAAMSAPTPISAIVHSSTLVTAGIYLTSKILNILENQELKYKIFYVSIISFILGGIMAIIEKDFKKIIAFSTISQIRIIFIILRIRTLQIAFSHIFFHALFKTIIFCGAGIIFLNIIREQSFKIINQTSFRFFYSFVIWLRIFIITGLIFSSSFYRKDLTIEIILRSNIFFKTTILIIGRIITLIYCRKIINMITNIKNYKISKIIQKKNSILLIIFLTLIIIPKNFIEYIIIIKPIPLISSKEIIFLALILTYVIIFKKNNFLTKNFLLISTPIRVSFTKELFYKWQIKILGIENLKSVSLRDRFIFFKNYVFKKREKNVIINKRKIFYLFSSLYIIFILIN